MELFLGKICHSICLNAAQRCKIREGKMRKKYMTIRKMSAAAAATLVILSLFSCSRKNVPTVPDLCGKTPVPVSAVISAVNSFNYDYTCSVKVRKDRSGYILAYDNNMYVWMLKTGLSGNEMWRREYKRNETSGAYVSHPYGLAAAGDGYYIAGDSHPFGSADDIKDYFAIKTDADGNTVWVKYFEKVQGYGIDVETEVKKDANVLKSARK
jgi:hypothetical protein